MATKGKQRAAKKHTEAPDPEALEAAVLTLDVVEQQFADDYLVHGNAARAYRAAGHPNANANVSAVEGYHLLRRPNVAAYIARERKKLAEATEVSRERIVAELAKMAFADPRQVATWGPDGVDLISSELLTDDDAAAIAEVSEKLSPVGKSVSFKMHDKKGALDSLARILGYDKTLGSDAVADFCKLVALSQGRAP